MYIHQTMCIKVVDGTKGRILTNFTRKKLLLPVYTVRDNKKRVQCHCDNECLKKQYNWTDPQTDNLL